MRKIFISTLVLTLFLDFSPIVAADLELLMDRNDEHLKELPKLQWGKDPFKNTPGFVESSRLPELPDLPELQGILYNSRSPSAILSGVELSVGEYYNDMRIFEIGRNYVLLQDEVEDSFIELNFVPGKSKPNALSMEELEK